MFIIEKQNFEQYFEDIEKRIEFLITEMNEIKKRMKSKKEFMI